MAMRPHIDWNLMRSIDTVHLAYIAISSYERSNKSSDPNPRTWASAFAARELQIEFRWGVEEKVKNESRPRYSDK